MDHFDKLFKEIEEYDKMTVEYLSYSKIGKGKPRELLLVMASILNISHSQS